MTATWTWDVFATVDGFGSYGPDGDWGGFWGKQGPEFLEARAAAYAPGRRMVFGAATFRQIRRFMGPRTGQLPELDDLNLAMRALPTTVVSTTLEEPLDWPDATLLRGDAVEVVARLKEESEVPLLSHGSLSMNRALMAAGLVDAVRLTTFPVVSGRTGTYPVFAGAEDFDLELLDHRVYDGRTVESTYRPTRH